MTNQNRRLLLGGLLILAGILVLLQNLKIFALDNLVWGILFAGGGLIFLYFLFENRSNWWAAIPGFTLIEALAGRLLCLEFPSWPPWQAQSCWPV